MQQCSSTAQWPVHYPPNRGPDEVWKLLQGMLLVKWRWDSFIWDLNKVLRLLTTAPSEFNYLFLTAFVKARAAYLACKGPFEFCTQQMIMTGLGTYCVQFATIYYRLFVTTLADAVRSEAKAPLVTQGQERLFQVAIREMEERYIEILELICLGPKLDDGIHGQDFESWITGTELRNGQRISAVPAKVMVNALVQRCGRFRLVRACADDMVRKIRCGDTTRSFLERAGVWGGPDVEIERVSRFPKVQGYPTFFYGEMEVQYYLTLTNGAKRTLYVICADRTMRISQHNGVPPACRPRSLAPAGEENGADLYLVTFDNGAVDVFTIDFRPHKENEHEHVPDGVWRLPMYSEWSRDVVTRDSGCEAREVIRQSAPESRGNSPTRGGARCGDSGGDEPAGEAPSKRPPAAGNEAPHSASLEPVAPCRPKGTMAVREDSEPLSTAPRVRVNVTVDAEGLCGGGHQTDIAELREHLGGKIDSVGREMAERQGNCPGACPGLEQGAKIGELGEKLDRGFERVMDARDDDARRLRQQRQAIEDMADGADRFLAGLQGQLTKKERELFFELIGHQQDGAIRRVRSLAEIGARLGGVSKQAICKRVGRLYRKHAGVADYVRAIREPEQVRAFSEMSPSERMTHGIDKSYGYEAG